jgi:hypothetical protein
MSQSKMPKVPPKVLLPINVSQQKTLPLRTNAQQPMQRMLPHSQQSTTLTTKQEPHRPYIPQAVELRDSRESKL